MSGFLFQWDFGGWSRLINDGGNIDLVAVVPGFWSGLIWFCFLFFVFFFLLWLGLIGGVWVHEFLCVHQWLQAYWNRFGFSDCVMCMMRGWSILVVVWWWWCGDWWWWSRGGGGVVIDDGGAIEVEVWWWWWWWCGDWWWWSCWNHAKSEKSEKKWLLEGNNKERLKNNILIKIEFWDVGGIVKWYGIMIKWLFGMVK